MQAFVTSMQTLSNAVSIQVSDAEAAIDGLKPYVNKFEGTPLLHEHCQSHAPSLHPTVLLPLERRQYDMHVSKYVGMLLQDIWSN